MRDVKVFYWLGEPNFGDMLNINICQKLFNVNPIETSPQDCEAAFIGSVLDDFLYKHTFTCTKKFKSLYDKVPLKIWGSGFITRENSFVRRKFNLPETYFRRFKCYALRGKYSLDRLKKIDKNQDFSKVVLGDPGLLAPHLLDKLPAKCYSVGIIPHHIEMGMDIWKDIQNNIPNSTIIRVDDTVENTINKIAQCDIILSSAMHGLIVADAFNIPNARLIASNKLIGGDYKFNDYYSVYGINNHRKIFLDSEIINNTLIDEIENNYNIDSHVVEDIQQKLIKTFPYN